MKKKPRLIILLTCVALFFLIAPYIVMYSMGYRIDFETWKIAATGGIYVRTYPQADQITVDSKINKKPGMFANSVFVQDLMPKEHSVLIKKDGYFDYTKTLEVKEKEVTKIENIILFKTAISYDKLLENALSFSVSPDKKNILAENANTKSLDFSYFSVSSPKDIKTYSLPLRYTSVLEIKWSDDSNKALIKTSNTTNGTAYYIIDFSKETQQTTPLSYLSASSENISFNPQDSAQFFYTKNNTLYLVKNSKATTLIKNLLDYKFYNGNIVWLSLDGDLNKSDFAGKTTETLSVWNINKDYINPLDYKIDIVAGKIFLVKSDSLFRYNSETKSLEYLDPRVTNYKLLSSPDGENIISYNNSEIYLYNYELSEENKTGEKSVKLFSSNYPETITNCFWLSNDYIIFEVGNKIIISEIDYRGNINAVELSKNYEPSASSKNPEVFFNSQDNKVYILNGDILYSSEKLTP